MIAKLKEFLEFLWLYFKGFRPVEFVRGDDRISLHPFGWRANGTGRMKRAKDAVSYLDSTDAEQWRQIYCGMTPFLVSDKGNVKHIDGKPAKLFLSNGRYQVLYKPEDARGRGRNGRDHKKRVYRSMLVAMAFLDFKKGDDSREIHHVNGYRTDDRLINLLVLTHEEHTRIHNMGPCGLSGTRNEALALLAETKKTAETESEAARKPVSRASRNPESDESAETKNRCEAPLESSPTPASGRKRRRGRRGGRNHRKETSSPILQESVSEISANAASTTVAPTAIQEGVTAIAATSIDPRVTAAQEVAAIPPITQPTAEASPQPIAEAVAKCASAPSGNSASDEINWTSMRSRLEDELGGLLETCAPGDNGEFPAEKNLTKRCKPVYRALRPYQTCPDAVAQFDAALACIRAIVRIESEWGKTGPSPLQSLLGELHQLLKSAVKHLAAGDGLERMCTEELLREELGKPMYARSSSARKLRQCLSIVCSRKEHVRNGQHGSSDQESEPNRKQKDASQLSPQAKATSESPETSHEIAEG